MKIRLSPAAAIATWLLLAALALGIVAHVGQVNTSSVPRHVSILSLNTTGLAKGLAAAVQQPEESLAAIYGDRTQTYSEGDAKANGTGIRYTYDYGMWAGCAAYGASGSEASWCSKAKFGHPIAALYNVLYDTPYEFQGVLSQVLPQSAVDSNEEHYGQITHAAMYVEFVACIVLAVAIILSLVHQIYVLLFAAAMTLVSALLVLSGNVIYMVTISHYKSILNDKTVADTPLGLRVSNGEAVPLLWTMFACLCVAVGLLILGAFFGWTFDSGDKWTNTYDTLAAATYDTSAGPVVPDYRYNLKDKNFWKP